MEQIPIEHSLDSQNYVAVEATKILLVTANVGSLFEDPEHLLQSWINEFLLKVSQLTPEFIALHLQEVGGKTYEKSMECVQQFIKNLCEANDLKEYSSVHIFLDEDYRSAEHFTALGNLYFTLGSVKSVKIWNFLTKTWEISHGKNIFSGNIEAIATKEKAKFPQHFFPECKWTRKGFMRTRWQINGTILDLVNVHLFHDASNLEACEEYPSLYCKTRRRALVHTLERFHLDSKNGLAPFFVFGDFNFRCDAEGVIEELTANLTAHRVHNPKHDSTKVYYKNSEGSNVLTLGKKEFLHADHQLKFKEAWLKKHDRELEPLREILFEYPIEFAPTYPYEEDPEMPNDYMSTRCPAWCDRILMSLTAKEIIEEDVENDDLKQQNPYSVIGEHVCMGDHKPIYLHFKLRPNQGTYRCCKCYSNCTESNKSTSHIKLASNDVATKDGFDTYCPYISQMYNESLAECSKLSKSQFYARNVADYKPSYLQLGKHTELTLNSDSSQMDTAALKDSILPAVSINIFDSDNINVCLCSEMTSSTPDGVDGTICQQCRNIIKKQPLQHRRTLISKRLVLSHDIIVNRIDSQYLNTHLDYSQEHHEPYTPESTESHSPFPELNSTSSSSSNYHRHLERPLDNSERHDETRDALSQPVDTLSNDGSLLKKQSDLLDSIEIKKRGVVSPGQLKSRLEDLQRSSLNSLNDANSGDDDVDNVDEKCQKDTSFKEHKRCCLSGCCNIC